jgi:hypothetical protein
MMSATMALLQGGKKGSTAPKSSKVGAKPKAEPEVEEKLDDTDAELADAGEAEVEEQGGAETDEDQNDADTGETGQEVSGEDSAVAIPTSKTEVHALKMAELPGVHEALGSPIAGFADLDLKGKKQALLDHLFPKGGKAKSAVAGSDTLSKVSSEIENIKTREEVESELQKLMTSEGETTFRKGGLLVKLSELGDFGEHTNLKDYILAHGIAKDYRTARYWMQLYTGLLEIGIPYADVEEIGWTKILILLDVLTKENLAEWKAKALAMNVATLKATVDAALGSGSSSGQSSSAGPSEIKSMVFKFHKDQTETAIDALDKAKKITGSEVKEVNADHIFLEFLANAPNKASKKTKEAPAKAVGYETDSLDVDAFFAAISERFPDTKEAVAFLFQDAPDDQQPPEVAKGEKDPISLFEKYWPKVEMDINIPD